MRSWWLLSVLGGLGESGRCGGDLVGLVEHVALCPEDGVEGCVSRNERLEPSFDAQAEAPGELRDEREVQPGFEAALRLEPGGGGLFKDLGVGQEVDVPGFEDRFAVDAASELDHAGEEGDAASELEEAVAPAGW